MEKLLPAGMGYVIAEASTCPEVGDLELPPGALQKRGPPARLLRPCRVQVVKERFRTSSLSPFLVST